MSSKENAAEGIQQPTAVQPATSFPAPQAQVRFCAQTGQPLTSLPAQQPPIRFCAQTGQPLAGNDISLPNHAQQLAAAQAVQQFPQALTPSPAPQAQVKFCAQTGQSLTENNKVNINIASEEELANLPGVSVALAKRAVVLREQAGNFTSVKDFGHQLKLQSHFLEQIERMAVVGSDVVQIPTPVRPGRKIDF